MHGGSNSVVGGDKAAARLTFRRGRRAFGMLARTNTSISERPKCQKNMLSVCIFLSKSMHVKLSGNVESNISHLSDPIEVLGHLRVDPGHCQLLTTHAPAHLGTSDCVQQNLGRNYMKSHHASENSTASQGSPGVSPKISKAGSRCDFSSRADGVLLWA